MLKPEHIETLKELHEAFLAGFAMYARLNETETATTMKARVDALAAVLEDK